MSWRHWLAQHGYGLSLPLYIAFVVYGSLRPFGFVGPAEAPASIVRSAMTRSFGDISLTDFAANILLFAPFGFLAAGVVARQPLHRHWASCGALVVIAAAGLSASIELMQLYLPARTFAPSDVVAETVGAIVGFAVWIVYRHEFEAILQRTATSAAARPAVFAALVVYTALFIAAHVYPLDLTADIGQLGRKYRDGRINFIPFSTPIGAAQLTKSVAAAFPIGAAAATIAGTLPTLALWLLTVAVLAIVELSQVLVRSQASDVTDILTGSVGTFLGIGAARALFQDRKTARPRSAARAPFVRRLFPFAWIAIVAAVQWWPLQFRGDPEFLRERVLKMVSSPYVLVGMSWTLLLGLSLGLVLATAWPSRRDSQFPRIRLAALAMVACSTLAAIEFGQLFVPARHPHPSNVVAGAIGVLLGLRVERVTARFGH